MWKCKAVSHKWNPVDLEGMRSCSRCKEKQKFLGYKLEVNRDQLYSLASNKVIKESLKKHWMVLVGYIALLSVLTGVLPEAWYSSIVFVLIFLGGYIWFWVYGSKKTKEEIKRLESECN